MAAPQEPKRYRRNLADEVDSAAVCETLPAAGEDTRRSAIFAELPAAGREHAPRDGATPRVTVEPLGRTFDAPAGLTVLEAAQFARVRLPRMCRNGTCRTCLCRIVSGSVGYTIEWPGLTREEKAQGLMLPCVAIARTDLLLDVPEAEEI